MTARCQESFRLCCSLEGERQSGVFLSGRLLQTIDRTSNLKLLSFLQLQCAFRILWASSSCFPPLSFFFTADDSLKMRDHGTDVSVHFELNALLAFSSLTVSFMYCLTFHSVPVFVSLCQCAKGIVLHFKLPSSCGCLL